MGSRFQPRNELPFASWSREQLERHQLERFQKLIARVIPANSFWSARLAPFAQSIARFQQIEELASLPLITKAEVAADQQAHPPYGTNLTNPLGHYTRLHQTSGTTAAPMRWLDDRENWQWILNCWEQLYDLMGLRTGDRLLFAFSFGPFLGFWAGFEGALRRGCFCLAAGGLNSSARLDLLLDNKATLLCATPTYALRLAQAAQERGVSIDQCGLRCVLVAGEPGGNVPAVRRRISEAWNARVIDHWGMTELGPLAIECEEFPGALTFLETECICEVIDPVTLRPVADGQEGELVVTNLGRMGSPLIRYRTGDRVRYARPDGAARGTAALLRIQGGILGRTDDMLTIRGNNVYPSQLEDLLRAFDAVGRSARGDGRRTGPVGCPGH